MDLAIIGLGKMGGGIGRRLVRAGHRVAGYDRTPSVTADFEAEGGVGIDDFDDFAAFFDADAPRVFWLMVPSGPVVDAVLGDLEPHLRAGDIVVDGGNSLYKDSMARAERLGERGIHFVDVGTSGGVWGLAGGYCMMVGGADEAVEHLRPALQDLAPGPETGWAHFGKPGAGHFVKMVHNGIEYGLMQAYAEGFAILKAKDTFDLDLEMVSRTWEHGSVIRSWLLELTTRALKQHDSGLEEIAPFVQDSGMGRWTVKEAVDLNVPAPVLTTSLIERIQSRDDLRFYSRLLAALRNQFGGHAMQAAESEVEDEPSEA